MTQHHQISLLLYVCVGIWLKQQQKHHKSIIIPLQN